jgi:hypothetical protein
MSDLLSSLLSYYHLDQEGYSALCAKPSFSSIPLIDSDPMTVKMVERINEAVAKKQRILVYGDYDCDGVMSTSIMVKTLRKLGARVAYPTSLPVSGWLWSHLRKREKAGPGRLFLGDHRR